MSITSELQRLAKDCANFGTADQREALNAVHEQVGQFVATNAVPPWNWDDLRAALAASPAVTAKICAQTAAPGSDALLMLEAVTAESAQAGLLQSLATPRLPVINPCL